MDNPCFASNMDMRGQLYYERQRRANVVAQRYAMQYVKDKIPHVNMHDLLQFLYHLLGDMVFEVLREDLHMQANAYMQLRKTPSSDKKQTATDSAVQVQFLRVT